VIHRNSKGTVEFIGDDTDHDVIRLITEFHHEGYFPLICSRTKGHRQVGAEFIYPDNSKDGKSYDHVWLRLNWPLGAVVGAIFFIKEVDSQAGLYHLRFCFRFPGRNKITFRHVDASIDTFIRPVLNEGRIEFRDFTGARPKRTIAPSSKIKVRKKSGSSQLNAGPKRSKETSTGNVTKDVCKFCKKYFVASKLRAHKRVCAYELAKCPKCGKEMYLHNLEVHVADHCPLRNGN